MAATTPASIMLNSREHYIVDESVVGAGATIYPGMLITKSSGAVIPNASAVDEDAQLLVAIENDKVGDGIDDTYVATETCYYVHPHGGALLYMFVETGANVAEGAALESAGGGFLQAFTGAGAGRILAFADEAVNNSGGGSGPAASARIRVRAA